MKNFLKKALHVIKNIIITVLCVFGFFALLGSCSTIVSHAEETTKSASLYKVSDSALSYFKTIVDNSKEDYFIYAVSDHQSVLVLSNNFTFDKSKISADKCSMIVYDDQNNSIINSDVSDYSVNLGNSIYYSSLDKSNIKGVHSYEVAIIFGIACILLFFVGRDISKFVKRRVVRVR